MGILTLKDGKQYQEQCPACNGIYIYDLKERKGVSDLERYSCPDCGHKFVAPTLHYLGVKSETGASGASAE